MGSCHSEMASRPKRSSRGGESTQSTVVGDDRSSVTMSPHKTEQPETEKGTETETEPSLPLAFGKDVLKEFLIDPAYHNLNHASYGATPAFVQKRLYHYQDLYERRPDEFIRYTYPELLDDNRRAAAELLRPAHLDELVFVPNATVGVNTVLRALAETWHPDGRDEILHFTTAYGACEKTIAYVADASRGLVQPRAVALTYPLTDAAYLAAFRAAVAASRRDGRRPRLALFDTLSSVPGIRVPYEALVRACRELSVLSLVDAAQGAGALDLDLARLDPDFFVTNCHKWLLVPRACAVFYVPRRNQHLLPSTVPTSHGYVPRASAALLGAPNPLLPTAKSPFVSNFEYVGTLDNAAYLCVRDAIEWRARVLGGEARIRAYVWGLAGAGGERVAEVLGTWVMRTGDEDRGAGEGGMVNVALPLVIVDEPGPETELVVPEGGSRERDADVEGAAPVKSLEDGSGRETRAGGQTVRDDETAIPRREAERIWEWMTKVLVDDYKTYIPVYYHDGRFWVRLSAQVYLDMSDFEWAGKTLHELCERVARKEYDL